MHRQLDIDSQETQEWLDALESVLEVEGPERAHYLLEQLVAKARRDGAYLPYSPNTAYLNTIPPHLEERSPGNHELEHRLRSMVRWNAVAMVLRAGKRSLDLGGHIASFASAATLYDVGFNHFWRAPTKDFGGDLVYFQGHSAPGIYARAFVEGRLTEDQLDHFRQEVDGKGVSSYPHPWLMPDFWQFPTVSMGLGPLQAIYQARFLHYLHDRGLANTEGRKVWAFMGDGEMDEPESRGAISLGAREGLDNLIFVINCNLQRLDGPVRGNGKIIQELEAEFSGAGWNVIKVIWGAYWDPLIAQDKKGILLKRMEEAVDGEYQKFKSRDGGYVRDNFFGKYPELREMVAKMSDAEIWRLNRGGHDPHKVYAAYASAVKHEGQPTVILAKTVKGYGMGAVGEGKNVAHQQKKMPIEALRQFRDRFQIPIADDKLEQLPYYRPTPDSPEGKYIREVREKLGGALPQRRRKSASVELAKVDPFKPLLEATAEGREISTTMAFVRMLTGLVKDPNIGKRVVPIVPDESRTFGMEGLFRQVGIYSQVGQLYEPEDSDQLMFYKEDKNGQILQEGINEAGATASFIAAGTSYANNDVAMIPFYIFYSMFGMQRVGDLIWAAGDLRTRGFLLGATSGRTTLNGEGLQHEDGHSHVLAGTVPNCVAYDPTFAYEVAVIIQDGLRRMVTEQEDVFYYITLMNENYAHPALPAGDGAREGIVKGMYKLTDGGAQSKKDGPRVQLLGSGVILREVIAAAELLKTDWGVTSDIWSCPSFNELSREGRAVTRWNMLHPTEKQRVSWVSKQLAGTKGPIIASTDYVREFADQIRELVPRRYTVLGTDGFGRSDSRKNLRRFFEINRFYVTVAALKALADEGEVPAAKVAEAIKKYEIDAEKPAPWTV
jgi:pyruvate dehydrogenase E1 component